MSGSEAISVRFVGRLGRFDIDVAFAVPGRGVTAVFGPSGCGKTTVLRCIAGLQRLDGHCSIGTDVWQDAARFRPAHRRAVGYVFQEASLFPHLSVRRNLLYGAGPAGDTPAATGFGSVVDLLDLAPLLDRAPHHLSGGERQRVAIGRALLSRPALLLMDEPLSALDRQAKDDIIPFLERLHRHLAIPTLYVTHDMGEVERLAHHLVLMRSGKVLAVGHLSDLQSDPTLPLAQGRTAAVSLDGVVESYDVREGVATVAVPGGRLLVPAEAVSVGERLRLRVGADDVSLSLDPPGRTTIANSLPACILSCSPADQHMLTIVVALGAGEGTKLLARVTRRSWTLLSLAPGQDIYAQVKAAALLPKP